MTATLELAEPGRVLDQRAPLLGLRGEYLLDLALADHGAVAAAETDVGEQLDEVGAPDRRAVDQVLALTAAVQPARDRDLAEVELRQRAVFVVEQQLDFAEIGRRVAGRTGEEDIIGLLRAQLVRAQRAGGPEQRVGHVRLAGPVRTDDDGDARLEANLDRFGERLEAAQLDRSQVHARGRLRGAADAARAPRRYTRSGPSPGSGHATSSRPGRGGCPGCAARRSRPSSSSLSPRTVSPHGQIDFLGHRSSCVAVRRILRGGETVERLLGSGLLGGLFRATCPDPDLVAVDHRRAPERAVVRRPLGRRARCRRPAGPGGRAPPGARSCGRHGVVSA